MHKGEKLGKKYVEIGNWTELQEISMLFLEFKKLRELSVLKHSTGKKSLQHISENAKRPTLPQVGETEKNGSSVPSI